MTREEAIDIIRNSHITFSRCNGKPLTTFSNTLKFIEALKMAIEVLEQPEREKGKWIDAYPDIEPNPMLMYAICSVCGCEQAISNKLNFCPDCGSDMRGASE